VSAAARPVRAERGRPLRLGVVGCGRAAVEIHLPALAGVTEIEVVALADPDPAALRRGIGAAPRALGVADPRALLEDESLDAVAICTPVGTHAELGSAALDAGKHLFVEKPLALTLADCDRLIAQAAASSLVAQVGFQTRWHRFARRARALVAAGALGPLELVRSGITSLWREVPTWRQRRATGGGVVFEVAMHHFDLWRFVLGTEVEEVTARTRSGAWEDESAAITARMSDGTLVASSFAERAPASNRLELHGREAAIAVSFYRFDGFERLAADGIPGGLGRPLRDLLRGLRELPAALAALPAGGEWRRAYREQWRQFAAATRSGVVAGATLEDGRRALAVALAAAESAARGAPVRVKR
jgi:myo-inositol 2-dehydrogenase/D-chiro-inositol 1-dehydrogenase